MRRFGSAKNGYEIERGRKRKIREQKVKRSGM